MREPLNRPYIADPTTFDSSPATSAIGFASIGQKMRLMYGAFPHEQYGTFR